MTLTFEEKYQAILKKDSTYEGLFITAVKTTGIFCRPVCTARKPKKENVEFFSSPMEAIDRGYRPCKVCKPMQAADEIPLELKQLLRELEKSSYSKLKDEDIKNKGLEPSTVRRWFKKHYGMTFHSYQRKLRLNNAYDHLNAGKSVTHTAFDNGFDSLSGFSDGFQKVFAASPSKAANQVVMNMIRFTTPLGPMIACATDNGIHLLEFSDRVGLETYVKKLANLMEAVLLPGSNRHLDQLREQVTDYFQGQRKEFNLKLQTTGTEFQNKVWNALQEIPYGETRTYSQQAKLINKPQSVRAVAAANGKNRIAIIIPCHRVIGKDGNLTGYAGGVVRKQWLLEFENPSPGLFLPAP